MQKTIIIGYLGQDAQVKEANGRQFVTFSIADSYKYKTADGTMNEQTQWIDCISNGLGVAPYLKKGTLVSIVGRLTAQTYEKDGQARASLRCNVQELNLLSSGNNNQQQAQAYQPQSNSMNDSNNDLPF